LAVIKCKKGTYRQGAMYIKFPWVQVEFRAVPLLTESIWMFFIQKSENNPGNLDNMAVRVGVKCWEET
jgi:hypothetical protein